MQKQYFELKRAINTKDIKNIIAVSKSIGAYQKTIQYSTYCYMNYLLNPNKALDSVYLVTSSILLGCKIASFVPKMDVLLEKVFLNYNYHLDSEEIKEFKEQVIKLELEMSILLDFDFNIEDQYVHIMNFSTDLNKQEEKDHNRKPYNVNVHPRNIKNVVQSLWVFTNDSLFYPFRFFFDQDSIFKACLFLSLKTNESAENPDGILSDRNTRDIQFIAEEILDGYLHK